MKMKPAAIIACLFVLALNGAASAQTGPAAEQVRYDWNRDGHMDKAMLVESNEDESVSLHIHFGRPNGRFAPPIIATKLSLMLPILLLSLLRILASGAANMKPILWWLFVAGK
ncbi:MAG: hypothetical protein FD128_2291 [Hyphomonadaceae bacterium]|nr:MAG: hypothetical protein FD128_2291 [Hyphomonadaceae bacterium]